MSEHRKRLYAAQDAAMNCLSKLRDIDGLEEVWVKLRRVDGRWTEESGCLGSLQREADNEADPHAQ